MWKFIYIVVLFFGCNFSFFRVLVGVVLRGWMEGGYGVWGWCLFRKVIFGVIDGVRVCVCVVWMVV